MAHHHPGARTVETLGSLLMSLPLLRLARVVAGKGGRGSLGSIMLERPVGVLEAVSVHNSYHSRIIRRRRTLRRRWMISLTGHNPRHCIDHLLLYLSASLLPCSGRCGEKSMVYHTYLSDLYLCVAVDDSLLSYSFTFRRLFSSFFHAMCRSNTLSLHELLAWFTVNIAPAPLLFLFSHTSNLCFYVPSSVFSAQSLYFLNLTSNLPGHHPFLILLLYSALSSMIRPPYSLLSFLSFFCCPLLLFRLHLPLWYPRRSVGAFLLNLHSSSSSSSYVS